MWDHVLCKYIQDWRQAAAYNLFNEFVWTDARTGGKEVWRVKSYFKQQKTGCYGGPRSPMSWHIKKKGLLGGDGGDRKISYQKICILMIDYWTTEFRTGSWLRTFQSWSGLCASQSSKSLTFSFTRNLFAAHDMWKRVLSYWKISLSFDYGRSKLI